MVEDPCSPEGAEGEMGAAEGGRAADGLATHGAGGGARQAGAPLSSSAALPVAGMNFLARPLINCRDRVTDHELKSTNLACGRSYTAT
jgi:hypothetical protein